MNTLQRIFNKHLTATAALAMLIFASLGCVETRSDADWKRALDGKKLSRAKNSGAVSDKVEIWFCGSGEYARQTQFSGFSAGGGGTLSMADEDTEGGTWRVEAGVLILSSQNGDASRYEISQTSSDVVELNGSGYLVENHRECR